MIPTPKPVYQFVRVVALSPSAARAWRALLLLLVVAVAYLALSPKPPTSIDLGWDKLNHMAAFTALAFAATMSTPGSRGVRLALLGSVLAFGGLIEILQLFVPGRASEWGDLLADSIGVVCGAFIAACWIWAASAQSRRQR